MNSFFILYEVLSAFHTCAVVTFYQTY